MALKACFALAVLGDMLKDKLQLAGLKPMAVGDAVD